MLEPEEALAAWPQGGTLESAPDSGLINRTWCVGQPPHAVLQWVHPIFDPKIHDDVAVVTERLVSVGIAVPRLLENREGRLVLGDERGCWRLSTYLPGRTLHRLADSRQAASAGRLVGRFHAALEGWDYTCRAPRRNIHDTPRRMAELEAALRAAGGHPFEAEARELGARILERWNAWDGELDQPERFCHGDLKISNLRFDDESREALGILDLDTLGPMPIASEMGDAWRSWCNPAGEDDPAAVEFDLELFTASARAWLPELELMERERAALVPGIERICLELASRFCADAVRNDYFLEDRERYPRPGEHNLLRARSQVALAASARRHRPACERVIGAIP